MSERFADKVARLTGAGGRIGEASARALHAEGEKSHGTRVNAIAPRPTDTAAMNKQVPADFYDPLINSLAIKRLGAPDDHVGPVLFLLSDEVAWMTGHVMAVDGGQITRIGPSPAEALVGPRRTRRSGL